MSVMRWPRGLQSVEQTQRPLLIIFFLFGLSGMSWVPRFPDVKANLDVNNGYFGILLSVGGIGAILALATVGNSINHFGVRVFLPTTALGFCVLIFITVNVREEILFIICNISLGWLIATFNIAINAQALSIQGRMNKLLLPKTAGVWSCGALTAILLSSIIVDRVSLSVHIGVVQVFCLLGIAIQLIKIAPHFMEPGSASTPFSYSLFTVRKFKVDWPFYIAMLMAIQMEYSMADWATIYAQEDLQISPKYSALPYLVFLGFMIIGRLNVHRVFERFTTKELFNFGALIGGGGYCAGVLLSHWIDPTNPLAYWSFLLALAFGGLGTSFMAPLFLNIAQARSHESFAAVIGQMGLMNIAMVSIVKLFISWVTQVGGLTLGLLIPGIMLISLIFFTHVMNERK
jgi:MFS family permease